MTFREGETEQFPVEATDKRVWYAIVVFGKKFPRYPFTSSKTGKKEFIEKIDTLHKEGQSYLLMGIWQGKWKTDIFILDETTIVKKIKTVIT